MVGEGSEKCIMAENEQFTCMGDVSQSSALGGERERERENSR